MIERDRAERRRADAAERKAAEHLKTLKKSRNKFIVDAVIAYINTETSDSTLLENIRQIFREEVQAVAVVSPPPTAVTVTTELTEEQEEEANTYARDILIPPEKYKRFVDAKCFTRKCIITFAQEIGIAAGIVLGRLQRDGYVPYNKYNTLKVKYKINGQHDTAA